MGPSIHGLLHTAAGGEKKFTIRRGGKEAFGDKIGAVVSQDLSGVLVS